MNSKLARVFIDRGIVSKGSIFEAYYNTKGISGQRNSRILGKFKLIGAQQVGEWIYFNTINDEKEIHRLRCDAIQSLDGMPIKRVAESHQLTEEGENHMFIRRGRRRKEDIEYYDDDEEIE